MKAFRKAVIGVLSAAMLVSGAVGLAACKKKTNDAPTQIVNGGFENNADETTWTGWTKSGTAFSARGVIEDNIVNGVDVEKTGNKFFSGLDGGTQKMTGTLQSDVFKLTGTGKVAFKMGAAKNGDKIFVQFFEEGGTEPLATITNTDFDGTWITDQLIRKVVDLSAHLDKNLYILITDNDNNDDFGYVNLDDFVVCLTEEDVTKYETERASQLERLAEPYFEEDETLSTIQNPGFETGDLTGWKLLSGTAFTSRSVVPTSQRYWNDRAVYGWGDYYLDGSDNGAIPETATGAIRSSKFTLGGDGYISFMLGAGKTNCYVALCDGTTNAELIKVTNNGFNDPNRALMLLRVYMDASEYVGRVVYLKIVDNNDKEGFGFINADDFRVSMTEAEVIALQSEQFDKAMSETYTGTKYNDINALRSYYENYNYLFPLEKLIFTNRADDVIRLSGEEVDLTQYLADVTAAVGSIPVTNIEIVEVEFDGTKYDDGFTSFNLSEAGVYTVTYRASYGSDSVEDTFKIIVQANASGVVNGDFEMGDLTGWTVISGNADNIIVSKEKTYFADNAAFFDQNGRTVQYFLQDGEYFLLSLEPGVATIKSSNFTLGGDGIISFKFGAAGSSALYIALCDAETDAELIKVTNNYFNDPLLAEVMLRRFMYASDYIGQELYIKIVDNATSNFGLITFDSLVVSLTMEEAQEIVDADKAWAATYRQDVLDADGAAATAKSIINAIRGYYANLEVQDTSKVSITTKIGNKTANEGEIDLEQYLDEAVGSLKGVDPDDLVKTIVKVEGNLHEYTSGFDALELTPGRYTVTYRITAPNDPTNYKEATFQLDILAEDANSILNGDFETGDLTGWTYEEGTENGQILGDKAVIGDQTFWGEEIPYNQGGNYHFDGWAAKSDEGHAYHLTSTVFKLSGSGYISFKMGGNAAAVKVYKEDGTQIAYYTNTAFLDGGVDVTAPSRLATMVTFVADLSEYLGEKLYIELHDLGGGSWGIAMFDDIVTYYETAPDVANGKDTVTALKDGQKISYDIAWETAENKYNG